MRFRGAFWYGGGTLFIFLLLMLISYPNDEEVVASFLGIIGEIGLIEAIGLDVEAPGFTLWLMLFAGSYLFIILAVTAVSIGARIIPTTDEDGIELLLGSQPKSSRLILFENWLGSQVALITLMIPTWIIMILFAIYFDASDIIPRVLIMFLFLYMVANFYLCLSMCASVMLFNKVWGVRVGVFYLIYSMIILFSATGINSIISENLPENTDLDIDIGIVNVNMALNPGSGLIDNIWNWTELGLVFILCLVMLLVSIYLIKSPDYNEKTGVKRSYLSFLPAIDRKGVFAEKYPLIAEQLQKDKGYIIVYVTIIFILFPYEMFLYDLVYSDDPETFAELINGFDVGLFGVLLGGYPLPPTYTGFAVTQFFALSWLYYGLFIFFISINIPTRDVEKSTQDILYGTSVHLRTVIISRVIAMMISFTFLIIVAAFSNYLFGELFGFERDLGREMQVFIISWLSMGGLAILLTGLVMLPRVSQGKRLGILVFLGMIFIHLVAGLNEFLSYIGYISVFYNFDYAGLALGEVTFLDQFLRAIVLCIISLVVFFYGLMKYEQKDLI
jgi:ABC-type transport system involved in multi-copper enzyme maturation permease subunit